MDTGTPPKCRTATAFASCRGCKPAQRRFEHWQRARSLARFPHVLDGAQSVFGSDWSAKTAPNVKKERQFYLQRLSHALHCARKLRLLERRDCLVSACSCAAACVLLPSRREYISACPVFFFFFCSKPKEILASAFCHLGRATLVFKESLASARRKTRQRAAARKRVRGETEGTKISEAEVPRGHKARTIREDEK